MIKILFIVLPFLFLIPGCKVVYSTTGDVSFKSVSENLREAEEFARKGKVEAAVESYKLHITDRLSLKTRPDWENPYFYWLIIGDLYLKHNRVHDALDAYELAEKKDVELGLVSDRYRYVAHWHASKKEYKQALDVLTKYRNRDKLLFDLTRDRIARQMIKEEEQSAKLPNE